MGQSARGASKTMSSSSSSSSRSYCPRAKRCSALEPVLEHCELASPSPSSEPVPLGAQATAKGKPMRLLCRLLDGYVKLMHDVASGAEFGGVSSFYGAGHGAASVRDYVPTAANAMSCSKETETAETVRLDARA